MLAIFDAEGVLVDGEFMPELAKLIGKDNEVLDLTNQGKMGTINWEDGLYKRVDVLKGISYNNCLRVASEMPLMPGAVEALRTLRNMGFTTITVSGGPSLLVDRVKQELGIDYAFSNNLIFTDSKLSGIDIKVTSNKSKVLRDTINSLGVERESIISTVDGANDLTLFEIGGLGIAFNAQPIVEEKADVIVRERNLMNIIPIIREHFSSIDNISTTSPK